MSLVFYVSGHGFGHASRVVEVVNALAAARPDLPIHIRSAAPRWLFDLTLTARADLAHVETDTGIVQIDSLHLDAAETIRRAAAFHREWEPRLAGEAAFLTSVGACLVVGDIPPLAFEAARRAGVRSAGLGNFTWDWIYAGYPDELTDAPDLIDHIRQTYGHAEVAWRLPMHGGFAAFPRVLDIPFVARRSRFDPHEARTRLGLPHDRPLVLLSFSGYGIKALQVEGPDAGSPPMGWDVGDYGIVTTGGANAAAVTAPWTFHLDERPLYQSGLRYEDIVAAVDVVMTKPGYGIIAECVANDTAILYTSRGHFVEYDVLVAEMPRFVRCGFIDHDDLFAGRWAPHMDRILAQPPAPERPPTNGADVVADRIVDMLRASS